jgi:hypothetical protein
MEFLVCWLWGKDLKLKHLEGKKNSKRQHPWLNLPSEERPILDKA